MPESIHASNSVSLDYKKNADSQIGHTKKTLKILREYCDVL